jgi:hypothetical protein
MMNWRPAQRGKGRTKGRDLALLTCGVASVALIWLALGWSLAVPVSNASSDGMMGQQAGGGVRGGATAPTGSWAGAINLSNTQSEGVALGAQFPRIAVSSERQIYAIWEGLHGGPGDPVKTETYLSHSSPAWRTWSTPEVVSPSLGSYSTHADVDVDQGGNVHLAWHERLFPGDRYSLLYREHAPGKDPSELAYYDDGTIPAPVIAVHGPTGVHVAWVGNGADVFYRRSDDEGTTWTPPTKVISAPTTSADVALAVDDSGHPHVAWREGEHPRILYRTGTPQAGGVSWEPVITPSAQLSECVKPSVVVSGTDVFIGWGKQIVAQRFDLFFTRCSGLVCTTPITLGSPVVVNTSDPSQAAPVLAVDTSGTIAAVWHGDPEHDTPGPGTMEDIWFTCSTDGGQSWAQEVNVSQTSERSIDPDLALQDGVAHVVWRERYDASIPQKYDVWYVNNMQRVYLPLVARNSDSWLR